MKAPSSFILPPFTFGFHSLTRNKITMDPEDTARTWLMILMPDSQLLSTSGAYRMSTIMRKEGVRLYEVEPKE